MTSAITSARDERDDIPTAPEYVDLRRQRLARAGRRVVMTLLVAFLVGGMLQLYGPRTATVEAEGGGYEVRVEYGEVTRPGLATIWSAEVRRPGGFDGPVTVGITADYFDLYDVNTLDPDPSSETTDGDLLVWEFDPPAGEVLRISLDARAEPGAQLATRTARLAVLEDGRPAVEVTFSTRVLF